MFSDEILQTVFSQEDVCCVPIKYQVIMIKAVEKALEEKENVDKF
jgi:hypothetical protein